MSPPSRIRSRIIRAVDFAPIQDAVALVEAARSAAAKEAARAADTREAARKEGYSVGYAEGIRLGAARFAAAAAESERTLFDLEGRIVPLVLRAIEDIVGNIGQEDLCRRLVTRAITTMGEHGTIVLRVAASEESLVRDALASIESNIEIIADRFLGEGEMVMESPGGRRHIGLREQLAALSEVAAHG